MESVGGTATWQQALQYCNGLTLASKSWRLPSFNELKSLVKDTVYYPAIDTGKFPATLADYYWSATTYAFNLSMAWSVNFHDGPAVGNYKTDSYYVRCVTTGP